MRCWYDVTSRTLVTVTKSVSEEVGELAFDVWVDFNTLSEGVVETLAVFAAPNVSLAPGRTVRVGDDDGMVATARIESVADGVVTLRVDVASISSDEPPSVARLAQ